MRPGLRELGGWSRGGTAEDRGEPFDLPPPLSLCIRFLRYWCMNNIDRKTDAYITYTTFEFIIQSVYFKGPTKKNQTTTFFAIFPDKI